MPTSGRGAGGPPEDYPLAETAHGPLGPGERLTARLNRTLLTEWAYAQIFTSGQARTQALGQWLHTYNHHRAHTALGGRPPISRVHDLPEHYI